MPGCQVLQHSQKIRQPQRQEYVLIGIEIVGAEIEAIHLEREDIGVTEEIEKVEKSDEARAGEIAEEVDGEVDENFFFISRCKFEPEKSRRSTARKIKSSQTNMYSLRDKSGKTMGKPTTTRHYYVVQDNQRMQSRRFGIRTT